MAFKASHTKPSKSSRVKKTGEEKEEVPAAPLSVEDIVGGGLPAAEPAETPVAPSQPAPTEEPPVSDADAPRPMNRPDRPPRYSEGSHRPVQGEGQGGFDRGGFGRGFSGGGFRRGGYSHGPRFGQRTGGFGEGAGGSRSPSRPGGFSAPRFGSPRYGSPRSGGAGETGETGYRRDWGSGNGEGHTQDINVPTETVRGILDIMPEGHGFLRPKFTPSERDVYISQSQIRRFMLRNGDMVEGQARQPKENERYWGLLKVEKVNEQLAEGMATRPHFEDLTPIYPNKQLRLETDQMPLSTRMIDLVAPIGFGQRGLIVSPPKAGKTTILKEIAAGITANYPEVHLMAALIGERPEEVTDLTRSIKGEVLASNFDESPSEQTRVAEVALDRAKRLVEQGRDVVVLLDSITRLARAYNLVVNPSGRTLSGGFDPAALYPAKKFLGAARCVERVVIASEAKQSLEIATSSSTDVGTPRNDKEETGGSLTVIGTALVETGSRMDDLIYEEFKGTGNMELHLSRALQERRIFPAIDVGKSGTRHDELLLGEEKMKKITTLRHMLTLLGDEERTMMLVERLGKTKTNEEFLSSLSNGG